MTLLALTTVFLLRSKSEVADKFAKFVACAETQTGAVVKALRCDNGGKYTSSEMAKFCQRRGIEQKLTPPTIHSTTEWGG